jgi:hypothetical protein
MAEEGLLARASRRHGLVEWTDARSFVTEKWLRHAIAERRLLPLYPAVYRFAAAPVTREQRLLAPCLAAGSDSAISHRTAAHEWGIAEFPDVLEIVTPRAQWPRLKNVRVHRSTDLRDHHVTIRHGIPITKPLRTLVDLGQSAPWAVADALEMGLANRLFGIKAADAALDEFSCRGRTGVGVLRRVLDMRALERGIPDGLLEPRMARLMKRHDLPPAVFQHWVTPKIRVDFAYPDRKIVIEVDGFSSRATPKAMDADLERQNELVMRGWNVVRFSWKQVVRQPDKVAQSILVTLTALEGRPA